MIRSKSKFSYGTKSKSSSLLTLNEIDALEKSMDWRKNYNVKPKEIGRGHFSKVFFITNELNNKSFAAKVIRRRKGGIDRLDKIRKEAEIIRKLNEKNIASVIRLIETHESFSEVVLICEFANGGSLFNLIQDFDTGLNQNYVKCVIHKLLVALEVMHSVNIVHLDIKADNILLRAPYPSTDIAICDFGLATELKKGINHKELVGTPDYMAPEVVNYEKITFNADMWSVGVVTYFLLTKISPFMGQSKDETLINVSKVRIVFDSIFDQPDFIQAKDFISSLCKKSPNLRLSSSTAQRHQWLNNLGEFYTDQPLDVSQQSSHVNITKPSILDGIKRSDQNMNNHSSLVLSNGQRYQSVNFQSLDLSDNYHLDIPDSPFCYSSTSCEDNLNENMDFKTEDKYFNDNENIPSSDHLVIKKKRDLSNVDEVADELACDSNSLDLSEYSSQMEIVKSDSVVNDSVFKEDKVTTHVDEIRNSVDMEKSEVEYNIPNTVQTDRNNLIIKLNEETIEEMLIGSKILKTSPITDSTKAPVNVVDNRYKKSKPSSPNYSESAGFRNDEIKFIKHIPPKINHPETVDTKNKVIVIVYPASEVDIKESPEINGDSKLNHFQPIDVNNNIRPTDNGVIKGIVPPNLEPCNASASTNLEHLDLGDDKKPIENTVSSESGHSDTVIMENNVNCPEITESELFNQDSHSNTPYPLSPSQYTDRESDVTPCNGISGEINPFAPAIDLDEYDNISENCDDHVPMIDKISLKREISSSSSGRQSLVSSDESNDEDFDYPSLLMHWRFSELCNLL